MAFSGLSAGISTDAGTDLEVALVQQAAASSGRPESPDVHAACSPCPWVKEESGDESGDCTGGIAGSAGTPLGVGWASLSRSCRCVTRTLSHTKTVKKMTSL